MFQRLGALTKFAIPMAWLFASGYLVKGAEPGPDAPLEIPGHGQFIQITISKHSWEGDRQGVSLKADGSWSSWSEGHSGMFPTRPGISKTLPPEVIQRGVQLIRDLKVPLTPHTDQERPPSKSTTEERLLTTTQGVFDFGTNSQIEEFLHSLRFYVEGKGILRTVEVPLASDPKDRRWLSLNSPRTLKLMQPGRSNPVRTWSLPEDRLAEVTDALPRENWTNPAGSENLRMVTDHGEFIAPAEGSAVTALLRDFYLQETGLEITPKDRFAEIRMRVGADAYVNTPAYFFDLNARGELLAGVDFPKQSPIEVPGGRKTVKVPTAGVCELVKLISQKTIWSKKREGNQPGSKLPNGLFKVTEVIVNHSQFVALPDPGGIIEKKLIELYTRYQDSPK